MLKLLKNTFKTTNDCIIIAAPLIVFLSILNWYYEYATDSINTTPQLILACVTMFVMVSGFIAAWLYMTKKTIALSKKVFVFDKDRAKALLRLAMTLPNGIGRLFLPIIGVISIYILIYTLLYSGVTFFVTKYVGFVDFEFFDLQTLMLSTGELVDKIKALTDNELLIMDCWYALILLGATIISFITFFWVPEIVYNEKNSFKALYNSVRNLFQTFKSSFLLFTYTFLLIVAITILNTLLMFNPFLYFLVLMLYYYFLVYIVVLLFTYYEQTFIDK